MAVLWVVREGTGLLRALNFTTTMTRSANTNSAIAVITHRRKSWHQMMSSITGVAPCCRPSCHGSGWPIAASATPAVMVTGKLVAMNVINRLSTSIVQCAPSTRKRPCSGPFFAAHHRHDVRRGPGARHLPRAWQLGRCGGTGGNPGLSNHNSSPPAMRLVSPGMRQTGYPEVLWARHLRHVGYLCGLSATCAVCRRLVRYDGDLADPSAPGLA